MTRLANCAIFYISCLLLYVSLTPKYSHEKSSCEFYKYESIADSLKHVDSLKHEIDCTPLIERKLVPTNGSTSLISRSATAPVLSNSHHLNVLLSFVLAVPFSLLFVVNYGIKHGFVCTSSSPACPVILNNARLREAHITMLHFVIIPISHNFNTCYIHVFYIKYYPYRFYN